MTGGAIRVGRAIALALARAGMDVAIGYHRSARDAGRTVRDLARAGARAYALSADLTDPRAARRLVTRAARALGGLDVLVNNAARFERTPFGTLTPAQYDRLLDLNLRAAVFCAQEAARLMRRRGGHIVNVGDAGATGAWPGYLPYTISKAGLVSLTTALARALRDDGITVNCVAPGAVLRPKGFPVGRWRRIAGNCGATVEDVGAAVLYFATCPRLITGQILDVDRTGSV